MKKVKNSDSIFLCKICDYSCNKKQHFNQHLLSRKHQMETNGNKNSIACECGKKYKTRTGLWKHKNNNVCTSSKETKGDESMVTSSSIIQQLLETVKEQQKQMVDVINRNSELQNTILELVPKIGHKLVQNNNKFNINIFLNEECKDAMNMSEFVQSMQIQMSDLQTVGKMGYVDGMSNIILQRLNALDKYKRPIHCMDPKRDIIYIKDKDIWERETDDNTKIKRFIQSVSSINCKQLSLIDIDENPDETLELVHQVCGGDTDHFFSEQKIIKNIAKGCMLNTA